MESIREHIKEKLQLVPKKPGCYQMKNNQGEIIYVGKAKILSNRLKSYFTGSHDAKTTRMLKDVVDFEYIITRSEVEAFLLELNYIKEYRPKYNIMLMDDKSYPYIVLTNDENPRLIMTRDISKINRRKGHKLFGPFPNAGVCRNTVELLNKVFPFRKCQIIPKKHCLYFDMGQCLAPCINDIKRKDYEEAINSISRFLSGNDIGFLNELENRMIVASEEMNYEKAIEYRDIINNIQELTTPQTMTLSDGISRDILGYYVKDDVISIQMFHMRSGKIIERTGEVFDIIGSRDEIILSYIYQFYDSATNTLPQELLVPYIEDIKILEELLKIKISIPIKGLKKKMVDLVCENAENKLETLEQMKKIRLSKTTEPIEELGRILKIPYPKIIELFDNSNIQGVSSVSAMVTYIDGIPSSKDYRKYKIKTVHQADDYHTMQEVLERRYQRLKRENGRLPGLIIVDGGTPQVRAAKAVFAKIGLEVPFIGLLKDDKHRTKAIINSDLEEIAIDKKSQLFLLLEAMQDEVHRFAITFFKDTHVKNSLTSILDEIEGIGKNRKVILLKNFDNIEEMANASVEKLHSLGLPKNVSENLIEKLKNRDQ